VKHETAIFAGGCFWCVDEAFTHAPGVITVVSGYTGGHTQNPTYYEVADGDTGHLEAVQVTFDPAKITYKKLLDVFWHSIDPFNPHGQFCDIGSSYLTAIFYNSPEQEQTAEASKQAVEKQLGQSVVVKILPASTFYPAEDYHQKYADKNPLRYGLYRSGSGRDARLKEVWGKTGHKKSE
jgi:methionine-S-sulfoxide reductase